MTEVLFTLTTIYVAYVIYSIVNGQKTTVSQVKPALPAEVVVEQVKAELIAQQEKPPVTVKKVAAKIGGVTTKPMGLKGSVRDPNTGEVATVTNNYRFTKRWIKEALVAEGLLDKIYKNNELDTATEAAIKTALMTLEEMEKYRG